jgi:plastocyanin
MEGTNVRRNKLVAGTVVLAVGIGGTAVAAPSATYSLSADRSQLKFNKSTIRAKAGRVTLKMANPSSLPHNVGVKGKGTGRTVNKGTYTFYCGVGSHQRTMKGKLIVR